MRLGLLKHIGLPLAGAVALTLAGIATAWSGGVPTNHDDNKSDGTRDDGSTVSRVVPQAEAEAALTYWTPERMQDAKPG